MRVLLDTNALIYLLDKRASKDIQDRLKGLLEDVEKARGIVLIPALVVSEYLTKAEVAGNALLDALLRSRSVEVAPFDHVAAVECAAMQEAASATGNKRAPLGRDTAWQKVKVDRQIVAIAKVRADRIVADDKDIHDLAAAASIPVFRVSDLPLPVWAQQLRIEGVHPVPPQPTRRIRLRAIAAAVVKPVDGPA